MIKNELGGESFCESYVKLNQFLEHVIDFHTFMPQDGSDENHRDLLGDEPRKMIFVAHNGRSFDFRVFCWEVDRHFGSSSSSKNNFDPLPVFSLVDSMTSLKALFSKLKHQEPDIKSPSSYKLSSLYNHLYGSSDGEVGERMSLEEEFQFHDALEDEMSR